LQRVIKSISTGRLSFATGKRDCDTNQAPTGNETGKSKIEKKRIPR
jgi:hypothetical protein